MVEDACQGGEAATLGVVKEATGLLTDSQLKGLGVPTAQAIAPSLAAGPSQPSATVAGQSPTVVVF